MNHTGCEVRRFLTGAFGPLHVRARLVAEQQAGLLGTGVDAGDGRATFTVSAVVREGQRAFERALDRSGVDPEHGVQQRVARDERAEALEAFPCVAES
jgi:hypothetical protein